MANKYTFVSRKAVKQNLPFRGMIWGVSGGGKTWSALELATYLKQLSGSNLPIEFLDTENSAEKYANEFEFNVTTAGANSKDGLLDHHPEMFTAWIRHYGTRASVLVIDSSSHEWEFCKQLANDIAAARFRGNSYAAWGEVTPLHNDFIQAIIACPAHIIVTGRGKMDHVQEKDSNGRTTVRKVGLGIIQRDGLEYEFDVVLQAYDEGNLVVDKTRASVLRGKIFKRDVESLAKLIHSWLNDGSDEAQKERAKYVYGDGTLVPENPAGRRIFSEFVQEFDRVPENREELAEYNRKRNKQEQDKATENVSTAEPENTESA